ncbi:hypothetical protein ABZX40_34660 [Streptomyces sp. NPDC004610]|uniref:hypothetical protein n=1 Tax=unclassified Streptomyces TaxID=2593676 RepID=UPI00339FD04E
MTNDPTSREAMPVTAVPMGGAGNAIALAGLLPGALVRNTSHTSRIFHTFHTHSTYGMDRLLFGEQFNSTALMTDEIAARIRRGFPEEDQGKEPKA